MVCATSADVTHTIHVRTTDVFQHFNDLFNHISEGERVMYEKGGKFFFASS